MATKKAPSRKGGRARGTGNIPALEKIRAHKHRLEKMLLDKALTGDVAAIKACLELIDSPITDSAPPEPAS